MKLLVRHGDVPSLARATGVTVQTVHNHLRARGVAASGRGNTTVIDERTAGALTAELGCAHATGHLTRTQVIALAAVIRAPGGVRNAADLATRSRLAYNTARRALDTLAREGWVIEDEPRTVLVNRRSTRVSHWVPSPRTWNDDEVLTATARVVMPLPAREPGTATAVPRQFRHLFWNTDPDELDLRINGAYIALRLMEHGGFDALTWALSHVPAGQLRTAMTVRGTDPRIVSAIGNHLEARR